MSVFAFSVWFWSAVLVFSVVSAVVAAISASMVAKLRPALSQRVAEWGDGMGLQEPLPSSPTHSRPCW